MNFKPGDFIEAKIDVDHHKMYIEDNNVQDDSFGTIRVSCVYSKYGSKPEKIYERGSNISILEEAWFNEELTGRKVFLGIQD